MAFQVENAFQLLAQSHERGRLAHAYLITGAEDSGKRDLAVRLANLVNSASATSLDDIESEWVQLVRPESKSRRITVDAMRAVERRVHLAAPRAMTKVGIVLDADRMMPEAANAFLKTLEEPPPRCLLLLLSSQPEQLLDTILSRCIHVALWSNEATGRSDQETLLLRTLAAHFEAGAEGLSPALTLMQKFVSILRAEKTAISKHYERELRDESKIYAQTTEGDWLKRREEFYKSRTESDYLQRRNVFVQILVDWLGDALRQQRGYERLDLDEFRSATQQTGEALSQTELMRRLSALEDLRTHLNTNANENLAFEVGFLAAFG